jgi:hypothetical protein
LTGGQTTSDIVEGGTPSTDTLMVCPTGDTTSTGVDLGRKIDLAPIFFEDEEKRDAETERFPPVAVSRASLSDGDLSFSFRRLDFSRPEPEEIDSMKEIEKDRRRDSQILIE